MFYRYTVGSYGRDCFNPFYFFESKEQMSKEAVLRVMLGAIEEAGFKVSDHPERLDMTVEVDEVHIFRDTEFEISGAGVGIDMALSQIDPDHVLVISCKCCHCTGESYGDRLLTVPRGSSVRRTRGDRVFNKDVNTLWEMDNASYSVKLPQGTKVWEEGQWIPISEIKYDA